MTDNMVERTVNLPEGAPMPDEVPSLLARLEACGDPGPTVDWVSGRDNYVVALSLSTTDVPELLAILKTWPQTREWPDSENPKYFGALAPIHAWRCLAQLHALEAVPVMLDMLDPLAAALDDWALDEFPHVFVYLGPVTLTPLCDYLADSSHDKNAHVAVSHGLRHLAKKYPKVRDEVVKAFTDALSRFAESDEALNGSLIANLMDLRDAGAIISAESAEVIERAFAADRVDTMCCGNWNTVRRELGVEGLGLVPEKLTSQRPTARFSPALDAMGQQLRQIVQSQRLGYEQALIVADKQAAVNRALTNLAIANRATANRDTTAPTLPATTYTPNHTVTAPARSNTKIGRNDPCSCGSGKKYKKCCAK